MVITNNANDDEKEQLQEGAALFFLAFVVILA
jgi:hypothetical protein